MRHHLIRGLACLFLAVAVPAQGGTLEETLVKAYENNPDLKAARASLRAASEGIDLASSVWRPRVTATGSYGFRHSETTTAGGSSSGGTAPARAGITVSQNLYRGGRSSAEVERARINEQTARARLFSIEQRVLLQAATAHADVVRDLAVLRLNQGNERVLERQLQATKDRLEVGEVTRTYVSQAESRLSLARANRIAAEGAVARSQARYLNIVGESLEDAQDANPLGGLPGSLTDAVETAGKQSYQVIAARLAVRTARLGVDIVGGELLPEISVVGEVATSDELTSANVSRSELSLTGRVSIPLYASGAIRARARQSREILSQRRDELDQAVRDAVEAATGAWQRIAGARAQISAFSAGISSSEIALRGVREEAAVGARTVLDVLDAEQEHLDSRVKLVRARRDQLVATLSLRQALGTLTAGALNLPVNLRNANSSGASGN